LVLGIATLAGAIVARRRLMLIDEFIR